MQYDSQQLRKLLIQSEASLSKTIPYRPEWGRRFGSANAAILLQQIFYLWERSGQQAFYKFLQPCKHKLYKTGDSWTEALGFSVRNFKTAIGLIGHKYTTKEETQTAFHGQPVEYMTDRNRVTWFRINLDNYVRLMMEIAEAETDQKCETHFNSDQKCETHFSPLDQKCETHFTGKSAKRTLPYNIEYHRATTTEKGKNLEVKDKRPFFEDVAADIYMFLTSDEKGKAIYAHFCKERANGKKVSAEAIGLAWALANSHDEKKLFKWRSHMGRIGGFFETQFKIENQQSNGNGISPTRGQVSDYGQPKSERVRYFG